MVSNYGSERKPQRRRIWSTWRRGELPRCLFCNRQATRPGVRMGRGEVRGYGLCFTHRAATVDRIERALSRVRWFLRSDEPADVAADEPAEEPAEPVAAER